MRERDIAKSLLRMAKNLIGGDKEEYEKFFNKKMKEWEIDSPQDLSDSEKKKFFTEIENEWTKDED